MPPRFAPDPAPAKGYSRQQEDLRQLALRLEQAVATLRALPRDAGTLPPGARSAWPEMVRRSRFVIEGTRQTTKAKPTPACIDDLDKIAMLMWRVTQRKHQLLWARACGVRWAELCQRQRRSRTTLFRHHRMALAALARAETEDSS